MVSPRIDALEVPVGRVAVPKRRLKTASPRRDATEAPVDWVAVPKTGRGIGQRPVLNLFSTDSPDDDACQ
ncbi:MAG: hypothetical protein PUH82_02925 [Bacteroidales bacterium]|nr:hypothetical protein [Bacteroidales bacterium]